MVQWWKDMSIHDRLNKKQLHRFNILNKATTLAPYTFALRGGVKPFICWALAEFKFSNFAFLLNKSYFLSNNVFGAKNCTLQSIPPQRGSGFADGRCNLLQVRIARKLSKLEPQVQLRNFTSVEQIQDRLGGVQHGWCKNNPHQTSSFNTSMEGGCKKC